jgi:8-oxo-dGTP pyrophosphatase MutT (NUDIX family)
MCSEPVSSYGVLVFRWTSSTNQWLQHTELCKDTSNSTGITSLVPQVLMIQRKDSLGFMDIMRGKYKVNEPDYIKKQLRGMTLAEREKLETMEFEEIWHQLWGSDTESSQRYAHDRIVSRQKLAELRAGVELPNGTSYTLSDLLRQEPSFYETPEWGFPKGRRDPHESDIQCAFRELREETSIQEGELWKVTNVAPLIEQFHGSNGVHYRHSYYVAQYTGGRIITFNALNSEMAREIGNLAWKTIDEAISLLRPENPEKREVLTKMRVLLETYSPVIKGKLTGISRINENTSEEQQGQYVFISNSSSHTVGGTLENTRRFFGTRQTTRRISDIRSPHPSTGNENYRSHFSGTGGRFISRN